MITNSGYGTLQYVYYGKDTNIFKAYGIPFLKLKKLYVFYQGKFWDFKKLKKELEQKGYEDVHFYYEINEVMHVE